MSMGPKNQQEKVEFSKFDRIHNAVKKAGEAYFERPVHYLYYIFLPAGATTLLLGGKLPWQFYVLMAVLTGVEVYSSRQGKLKKNARKSL